MDWRAGLLVGRPELSVQTFRHSPLSRTCPHQGSSVLSGWALSRVTCTAGLHEGKTNRLCEGFMPLELLVTSPAHSHTSSLGV